MLVAALAPRGAAAEGAEVRPLARPSQDAPAPTVDRFELIARSETYVQLFRRALLPGATGALVTTDTAVPITEYLYARAERVDSPWHQDAIDIEFAAWGQPWPTASDYERPFDGDVQTANVTYRIGPLAFKLGRQLASGGAARFSRFDGASVSGSLPNGLFASAYGGAVALPRWNAQPGYHQLGSAERELLGPDAELKLDRSQHWLAGARVGYGSEPISGSLTFHEQHATGGLERRSLGVDLGGKALEELSYGGSALVELDAQSLANLRGWLDLDPHPLLHASVEALRSEPGLLLSRQSVLSVFDSSGYAELGGLASLQACPWLRLEGSGYFEAFDEGKAGARVEGAARVDMNRRRTAFARVAYARVVVERNAYHSLRASLARTLTPRLTSTLDLYGYFYDKPVQGYRSSSVYAGTLNYQADDRLALLWGASLAQSPYAELDAQTMLRLSYDLDAHPRERAW